MPIKVVSVAKIRGIEADADATGISYMEMMERAGSATAARARSVLDHFNLPDARVTVLIGPGNNGGDGLVTAREIAKVGKAQVRIYQLKPRDETDPLMIAVREAGLFVADAGNDQQYRVLRNMIASTDLLIDALFGIGIELPLRPDVAKLLRNAQQAIHERNQLQSEQSVVRPTHPAKNAIPPLYIIAVDCPSGLDCDTGQLDAHTLYADETITYIAAKPGLLRFPGAAAVGDLHVARLQIPDDLPALKAQPSVLADGELVRAMLPNRPADGHKGTFGKAQVIGGSDHFMGAPALSAMAAYRAGAGLVTVAAAPQVVNVNAARFLEPTWLPLPDDAHAAGVLLQESLHTYDALLIGPGWGKSEHKRALLAQLLAHTPPLVIDADGLNLLAEIDGWASLLPANTILTPHPGELARLAGLSLETVSANRWQIAVQKAAEWNVILVAKGAHTVIAAPDGRQTVLPFKTDALATAGTGDVLAGLITGILAQGCTAYDAAVIGGYLHGMAGLIAAEDVRSTRAVIASDLLSAVGKAFEALQSSEHSAQG